MQVLRVLRTRSVNFTVRTRSCGIPFLVTCMDCVLRMSEKGHAAYSQVGVAKIYCCRDKLTVGGGE